MGVRRFSVSVPPDLAERVRAAADASGLTISEWLAQAATERLDHEQGMRSRSQALDELLVMIGPIPEEHHREAAEFLIESGVLPPDFLGGTQRRSAA